ncbi:MAG: M20/M25/M40 family metallo-hydrolase [Bryobacterales bacterium]|nr:M20/M25/M40 family metallo-hydrolase [Bryobacterales bacterium]
MLNRVLSTVLAAVAGLHVAAGAETLAQRAQRYCVDLIRIDTSNPPGNETPAAQYIARELAKEGIAADVIGGEPSRKNLVARLKGTGEALPLMLMAHTDVVPVDPAQWTVPAFGGLIKDGFLYGRGAQDTKCLLAAEMAVFVDLKQRGAKLKRDVILLAEADEEAGSTAIQWLIANAWEKINAEFAINEGGYALQTQQGTRLFEVQTSEKIPTRLKVAAKGVAGHGSLPRPDNAVLHLSRAVVKLSEADQPVRLNTTTRRYLTELAKLPEYSWLGALIGPLENPATAAVTANQIRARDPELAAILQTTVSPTMLNSGVKINVIPNSATAGIDVRRLPNETREEIIARFRQIVNDPAIEIAPAGGQEMPSTEPSALTTLLYVEMEKVLAKSYKKSVVVPYMSRGATDGAFLRQKGMAVYGAPVFVRVDKDSRAHGNDERMSLESLANGTLLLQEIVAAVAAK